MLISRYFEELVAAAEHSRQKDTEIPRVSILTRIMLRSKFEPSFFDRVPHSTTSSILLEFSTYRQLAISSY